MTPDRLNLLMMHGPLTPGSLADRSGITAGGAITAVIDRLEKAGLAHRARATNDRRKVIVTAEAHEAWRRLAPHYEGVQRRWQAYLKRLSEDQVRFAVELFSAAAEINEIEIMNLRAPDLTPAGG